jgi:hypothetical protein
MRSRKVVFRLIPVFLIMSLAGCASPPSRMGMVKTNSSGLQFGSVVEKNIVTDSSFFQNKKIKIRTRNTSGDTEFDLKGFTNRIKNIYASKGYLPTDRNDFGLIIDVNVMYSGQIQSNLAKEYSFLGAAGGGLFGAARTNGGAIGSVAGVFAGAALGNIIGSYVTDDTYIIVSKVTFGEIRTKNAQKKSITFSRSPKTRYDSEDQDTQKFQRGFKETHSTGVAVFAGGRNVNQARIVGEVRERIVRIVGDII